MVVVGDDVDLLAAQLGDDHAHPRAPRADAGADRIDAVRVRDDRDLRAVARLARDVGDLHQAVGDLGHLELEQALDQLGITARDDDARPARRGGDLLDDGLDPLRVVVALAVDLLGLRQQRLDALAQLNERVARVGDRKSTRLNSSHANISYAVFCLKKKKKKLSYLMMFSDSSLYAPPIFARFIFVVVRTQFSLQVHPKSRSPTSTFTKTTYI